MSETGGARVGRLIASDAELARILAALDATLSRPGRFLVVAGEPGVGKTRLAQEVLARVSERGGSAAEVQPLVKRRSELNRQLEGSTPGRKRFSSW